MKNNLTAGQLEVVSLQCQYYNNCIFHWAKNQTIKLMLLNVNILGTGQVDAKQFKYSNKSE